MGRGVGRRGEGGEGRGTLKYAKLFLNGPGGRGEGRGTQRVSLCFSLSSLSLFSLLLSFFSAFLSLSICFVRYVSLFVLSFVLFISHLFSFLYFLFSLMSLFLSHFSLPVIPFSLFVFSLFLCVFQLFPSFSLYFYICYGVSLLFISSSLFFCLFPFLRHTKRRNFHLSRYKNVQTQFVL